MRCLSCGTTDPGDQWRRSLCEACYKRAYLSGMHRDYPACGPRPVPYRSYAFYGQCEPEYCKQARERYWQREITRVRRFEARRESEWLAQRGQRGESAA